MWRFFSQFISKHPFLKHTIALISGTVAGQLIVVLTSPILTRLYSPEDFGLLAIYSSLLLPVGVIASLRYQLAIPLADTDTEASKLIVISVISLLFITVLYTVLLYVFGEKLLQVINAPKMAKFLWMLPLGVIALGIYQVLNYEAIRQKSFIELARTKVSQSITSALIPLAGYPLGIIALLAGQVSGQAMGITRLIKVLLKNNLSFFRQFKSRDLISTAVKFKSFPFLSTWGGLLNVLSSQTPALFFTAFFGPATAGLYLLSDKAVSGPLSVINSAISNVFFGGAREKSNGNEFTDSVDQMHIMLSKIIMPIGLALFLFSADLFKIVFGEHWQEAGSYTQALSLMLYFQFISSPLSMVFTIKQEQSKTIWANLLLFILRVLGIAIGAYFSSVLVSIWVFSCLSAIAYINFIIGTTRSAGVPLKNVIKIHFEMAIYAIAIGLPIWLVNKTTSNIAIGILIFIIFSSWYYIKILKNFNAKIKLGNIL